MSVVDRLPYKNYQDNPTVVGLFLPFDGYVSEVDSALVSPLDITSHLDYYGQILGYGPFWSSNVPDAMKINFIQSGAHNFKGTKKGVRLLVLATGVTTVDFFYGDNGYIYLVLDEAEAPYWSDVYRIIFKNLIPFIKPAWVNMAICYPDFMADFSGADSPLGVVP